MTNPLCAAIRRLAKDILLQLIRQKIDQQRREAEQNFEKLQSHAVESIDLYSMSSADTPRDRIPHIVVGVIYITLLIQSPQRRRNDSHTRMQPFRRLPAERNVKLQLVGESEVHRRILFAYFFTKQNVADNERVLGIQSEMEIWRSLVGDWDATDSTVSDPVPDENQNRMNFARGHPPKRAMSGQNGYSSALHSTASVRLVEARAIFLARCIFVHQVQKYVRSKVHSSFVLCGLSLVTFRCLSCQCLFARRLASWRQFRSIHSI